MLQNKRSKAEVQACYLLRQAFSRSYLYWDTIRRAKRGTNQYECAQCHKIFKLREVAVDHKIPVVDLAKGWENICMFAARLFCHPDNLWVLCRDVCHQTKSNTENKLRRKTKGGK